jgi:hypothetical protein
MKTEPEEVFYNSLKRSGLFITLLKVMSGSIMLVLALVGAVLMLPFLLLAELFKAKK